jgi:putative ABC transport system substrate-binding protein
VRDRYDGLVINSDPFFSSRHVHLANLAVRRGVPAIYTGREFPDAGGLMSYGSNIVETWRQSGAYVGRILKGAKPADLPVVQSTKFELVINAETAKMLGISIPPSLLSIADEVIE